MHMHLPIQDVTPSSAIVAHNINYHKDEKITPEQAHRNALQLAENMPAWKGFEVLGAN